MSGALPCPSRARAHSLLVVPGNKADGYLDVWNHAQDRLSRKARVVAAVGEGGTAEEVDWDAFVVRGTRTQLEKSYFRRAPPPACLPRPAAAPLLWGWPSTLGEPRAASGLSTSNTAKLGQPLTGCIW